MNNILLKSGICLALMILLFCTGTVAAESTSLVGYTLVEYDESFVTIASTGMLSDKIEAIIIFTDSSMVLSRNIFEALFEVAVSGMDPDINVIEITGFATIDGRGWVAKWTPYGGYTYYPLV